MNQHYYDQLAKLHGKTRKVRFDVGSDVCLFYAERMQDGHYVFLGDETYKVIDYWVTPDKHQVEYTLRAVFNNARYH